ncbi:hypothetical protein [Polyangium jinanense]|uniref:Uncharacterized protein n=1 Tax=Polyangium jinanense TaxID=2829994 RepID=A0A9X3X7G9_9BACT|nr:hypothetical protein [Polyangium jinanense]MDC3961082.1 hypothetical protein [Polyangium jinanense]MDC3982841.1 hypothetical protein [Polyangium jinanense]
MIIRWFIVAILFFGWAALLWPLGSPPPASHLALPAMDEILAYRVDPEKPVAVKVPSSIDAVVVSTWALVARTTVCDPKARFSYGFEATFVDENGKDVQTHRFELESRLSCDDKDGATAGEYAARVAQGDEWVLDPRTTTITTGELLPRGGVMRMRGLPISVKDVLSRVEGRYRRGSYERTFYEMSLDDEDRSRVVSDMTSLGFEDLPETARSRALSGWDRRLDAAGLEGKDYSLRRLLLRNYRTPFPAAAGTVPGYSVGERHAAAVNVMGAVELDVLAPPGRSVTISEGGGGGARVLTVPEDGVFHVSSSRLNPRTFVVEGKGDDFLVRFVLPKPYERAQIGDLIALPFEGERLEIRPDVRVVKYLKLDPERPVLARVAPEQPYLGLLLRAELPEEGAPDSMSGTVVARWGPGPNERAELRQTLPRSRFERWGRPRDQAEEGGAIVSGSDKTEADATDPRRAILRIPKGATKIELLGDAHMRVHLRVLDPGVPEDILRVPYRVELAENEIWRYAPFDVRTWTPIRAENQNELERQGRIADLYEQVRIELRGQPSPSEAGQKPERTLVPDQAPVRRRFLAPHEIAAKELLPNDGWTPLDLENPLKLGVGYAGERGGRLKVLYRAHPSRLGKMAELWIDGKNMVEQPIASLSGVLRASLKAGIHDIQVKGIGDGLAYADAAPWEGGGIMRRRDVFELPAREPLSFTFRQRPGESLTLVLFVISEAEARPFKIRYSIDGGKPRRQKSAFFRSITTASGELSGRTGDAGMGLLWEARRTAKEARNKPDGLAKVKIPIGDDLEPGMRTIKIESVDRVWIGAVLVGQAPLPGELEPRLWSEDDL